MSNKPSIQIDAYIKNIETEGEPDYTIIVVTNVQTDCENAKRELYESILESIAKELELCMKATQTED